MWSNERFSIIRTTMCLRLSRPTGMGTPEVGCLLSSARIRKHVTKKKSNRDASKEPKVYRGPEEKEGPGFANDWDSEKLMFGRGTGEGCDRMVEDFANFGG